MSLPIITSSNTSISRASSPYRSSKNFRDPSFSSYLNGAEESFVLQLRGIPNDHVFQAEETEIDVFNTEKYFNENYDADVAMKISKIDDPSAIFAVKEQLRIATPSIHSEASWNSRCALLHAVPRNQQPGRVKKKNFLASIGCNCSCRDKNSVRIDNFNGKNCFSKSTNNSLAGAMLKQHKSSDELVKSSQLDFNCAKFDEPEMDNHFSFPVFNPTTGHQARNMQAQGQERDDSNNLKSPEVFGPSVLENGKYCLSLEKKISMLTWDAIAPEEITIPSISSELHNDSDSDASSDLFEIESLSRGSLQASDDISGCITHRACYAPSEASIEWSVITASTADFSVLSDSEDLRSNATTQKMDQNSKHGSSKETTKRRSSILSGCKSHKAVSVAGDAHRAHQKGFSNPRKPLRLESFAPVARFHDQNKLAHFDARNMPPSFDACILSQPHHGSAAHLLYT